MPYVFHTTTSGKQADIYIPVYMNLLLVTGMIRTHEHDYKSIYSIGTVAVIVRDTQHALCFSPIGWVYQLPSVQEVGNKYQVKQWHAWRNKVPGTW